MKRRLIILRRVYATGFKNFIRNSWLSIAAIAVMIVSIMIILSSIIANVAMNNIITELSKNIKISVYFIPGTTEKEIFVLKEEFDNNEDVFSTRYISEEEAQQAFISNNQDDKQLLQGLALLGSSSLPASLEISVDDLGQINQVGEIALQEKFVDIVEEINLGKTDVQKTIDRAASAQKFITRASIISAGIFALVSMLIIFNTIRMAIFTRQDEIRTEKLLGATRGYIRGPFLVESSIYGVIAGSLGTALVLFGAYIIGNRIANQAEFNTTKEFFSDPNVIIIMFAGSIIFGVLVGVISSAMAMVKYLKLRRW